MKCAEIFFFVFQISPLARVMCTQCMGLNTQSRQNAKQKKKHKPIEDLKRAWMIFRILGIKEVD